MIDTAMLRRLMCQCGMESMIIDSNTLKLATAIYNAGRSESQSDNGWLPIESAPKDGTRVILYREGFQEDMCIGWWNYCLEEWIAVGGFVFGYATHWQENPDTPNKGVK